MYAALGSLAGTTASPVQGREHRTMRTASLGPFYSP